MSSIGKVFIVLPPDYFDLVDICIILCLRFGDKIFGRRKNEPDKDNEIEYYSISICFESAIRRD